MSRDDGFGHADLDVRFLRDAKVRHLRRLLTEPGDAAAAEHLYLAVVLSSWETGYRVTIDDALTFEVATPERVAALKAELLDAEGKIPLPVWERWFRPAWERREKMRAAGREGNRRRWHADGSPTDSPPDSPPDSGPDSRAESQSVQSRQSLQTGTSQPSDSRTVDGENARDDATAGGPVKPLRTINGSVPAEGPCRICGGHVNAHDSYSRVGPGWIEHAQHPDDWQATA